MDPNTQNTPTTPIQPVAQAPLTPASPQPVAAPAPVQPPMPSQMDPGHVETKSNMLLYIMIGLLLLILIALSGLFFYRQFAAATNAPIKETVTVPTQPPVTPTIVVPTYSSPEETDVMGVDVGDVDSQLKIIQDDINKL